MEDPPVAICEEAFLSLRKPGPFQAPIAPDGGLTDTVSPKIDTILSRNPQFSPRLAGIGI